LAENPLLLTIMALVHKAEFDLPKQRALLYDKCAEAFIVNRNKAKDLLFYDENDMKACHEFLGYSMQVKDAKISTYPGLCKNAIEGSIKDPMAISTNELEELLLTYLKGSEELREEDEVEVRDKIKEFLDSASRRIGLLVERGEDVWGFGHRSFQEYFAALYITQNTNGSEELWKEVQNKIEITSWIEPLKLLAGIYGFTNRKALVDFVRKIMEEHRKKDSLDSKRLILAGEIIGEVTLNDKILVRQIASDVIDNFMSTWDLSVFSNLKRVINNFYQMDDVWLNFVNILRKRIILFEMNPTKYLQTMFYGFYVDGRYDDTWIDREIEKLQI
jgi:predicted NACHT family NTPase